MLFHWDQALAVLAAMLQTLAHVVPMTWADFVTSSAAVLPSDLRENCIPPTRDVPFYMNITRTVTLDGDEFTTHCKQGCYNLCSATHAVMLRCSIAEYPQCRCKCPSNRTLRTAPLSCVKTLKGCKYSIFHFDVSSIDGNASSETSYLSSFSSTSSSSSMSSSSSFSPSRHPSKQKEAAAINRKNLADTGGKNASSSPSSSSSLLLRTTVRPCKLIGLRDVVDIAFDATNSFHLFKVSIGGQSRPNVSLVGSREEYLRFSGRLLQIEIDCRGEIGAFCIGVKFSGSRKHSISIYLTNPPSAAMTFDPRNRTQESQATTTLETVSTGPTKTPEEEQLETIITGLCISVAVLLVVWLSCFLVEKKVQRKSHRTSTISTPTSSSKTYTYEVSSVRKTLMEMFDMPMIKIQSSDESNNRPSSLSSDKSESNEQEDNVKSDNEDVFIPEASGYSTSSSDDLKEQPSDKSTLLEIPEQKSVPHEDFAHWIPMAKAQSEVNHDSPSKREHSPKNSPKKIKFGGKKYVDNGSPSKPKKDSKIHPPILKSAMKSSNRKKHASVRVAMEDTVVYTRPNRSTISNNNNYTEMDGGGQKSLHADSNNVRDSPTLQHTCTKL